MTLAAAFLMLSLYIGKSIEGDCGRIGVRFKDNYLESKELIKLYEGEKNAVFKNINRITLWSENKGSKLYDLENNTGVTVNVVTIFGSSEQVFSKYQVNGVYITKDDEAGCMLSEETAYKIFGSADVLGKEVLYNNKIYYIRGIIDKSGPLFVIEDSNGLFSYMEVDIKKCSGNEQIRQLLLLLGVSIENAAVVEWDTASALLVLLQSIGLFVFNIIVVFIVNRYFALNRLCIFLIKAIAAGSVLIFLIINVKFPIDYIPSKWSNFEFFGDILANWKENYGRYIEMPYIFNDRMFFNKILFSALSVLGSILCSISSFIVSLNSYNVLRYYKGIGCPFG